MLKNDKIVLSDNGNYSLSIPLVMYQFSYKSTCTHQKPHSHGGNALKKDKFCIWCCYSWWWTVGTSRTFCFCGPRRRGARWEEDCTMREARVNIDNVINVYKCVLETIMGWREYYIILHPQGYKVWSSLRGST